MGSLFSSSLAACACAALVVGARSALVWHESELRDRERNAFELGRDYERHHGLNLTSGVV